MLLSPRLQKREDMWRLTKKTLKDRILLRRKTIPVLPKSFVWKAVILELEVHYKKKSAPKPGSSIRQTARNQPGPSRVRPSASSTITSITNTLPNNESQMDTTTSTSTSGQTQGRNQNLEEFRSKRMVKSMIESMEQELSCTICREIFVESSVLGCGHTFCGFCISKWFENASSCPICRSVQSTSPIKHNQLDNYVVKVHSLMTTEKQARREAMIQERRAEIERSRRADVRPLIVTPGRRRYIFERHSSLNPSMQSLSPPDVTNNNNQLPRTHDSLLLTPRVRVPIPAMSVNGRELTADSFANAVNILLGGNSGNIHVEFVD